MKPFTRMACERNLHPECWVLILNSPAQQPLKMKCQECRDKYIQLASSTKEASQRVGLRKYLLARNIALERQNALLEKEIADLKAQLKQGGQP